MRMIVYGVMLLASIFYIGCIPITVRLRAHWGATASGDVQIGLFGRSVVQRPLAARVLLDRLGNKKRGAGGSKRAYRYLLAHTRKSAHLSLSMPDAFYTAQAAAVAYALGALARIELRVWPDFHSAQEYVTVTGIASVRLGHIIVAALWRFISIMIWRRETWRNIRSKAL